MYHILLLGRQFPQHRILTFGKQNLIERRIEAHGILYRANQLALCITDAEPAIKLADQDILFVAQLPQADAFLPALSPCSNSDRSIPD